jgi:hypothetical protein
MRETEQSRGLRRGACCEILESLGPVAQRVEPECRDRPKASVSRSAAGTPPFTAIAGAQRRRLDDELDLASLATARNPRKRRLSNPLGEADAARSR